MPDTTKTVKTLDFQMLDADRQDATLIKLDNPKDNITREMVSSAMQPAFANGWFLTSKGSPAMYLGDVTITTSTKVKLDGQDFYVTPSSLNLTPQAGLEFLVQGDINVSGATIQGYNIVFVSGTSADVTSVTISENRLTATFIAQMNDTSDHIPSGNYRVELVIQGTIVSVPVYITAA